MLAHRLWLNKPVAFGLILLSAVAVATQESGQQNPEKYLIQNPESIRLELLPRAVEVGEKIDLLKTPYVVGDKMVFRLQMTNTSLLPVQVPVGDPYSQDRPLLYKDGDVLAYRKDVAELVENRNTEVSEHVRSWQVSLQPNESKILQRFNLYDWYDSLRPGHYQLSIKHRFQLGQEFIESSSLTFEIVPKPRNENGQGFTRRHR